LRPWIHTAFVLISLGLHNVRRLGASEGAGRHVVGRLFLCFYSNNKLLLVVESTAYCYNMLFHSYFKVSFISWAMTQFIHSHLAFFSRFPFRPKRQATFHPHTHSLRNVRNISLQTKWKMENFLFETHVSQKRYFPGTHFSSITLYSLWCYSITHSSLVLLYCLCL
jgi:hypothetical protein